MYISIIHDITTIYHSGDNFNNVKIANGIAKKYVPNNPTPVPIKAPDPNSFKPQSLFLHAPPTIRNVRATTA